MTTRHTRWTTPSLALATVLTLVSISLHATPLVSGSTISWQDDGWYQVQDASTFQQICGGGSSCSVSPGLYIVINHTTGQRYDNIQVGNPVSPIIVAGNILSWPDDGWYQVQRSDTYESVCTGGRSCRVSTGTYIVINHTTGTRYERIVVSSSDFPPTEPPVSDSDSPSPPSNLQLGIYSATAAELSWQLPNTGSTIVATEVYRDGVLQGQSTGTSWYDDQRTPGGNHLYEVKSIDEAENRSSAVGEGRFETARLETGNGNAAFNDYGEVAIGDNYAFVPADRELIDTSDIGVRNTGAVYVFAKENTTGSWQFRQRLTGSASGQFGMFVAIDAGTLAVSQRFDYSRDPALPVPNTGKVTLFSLQDVGDGVLQWRKSQELRLNDPNRLIYRFGDTIAIDGDTMFIGASLDFSADPVYVYTRDADGVWQQTQSLSLPANSEFRGDSIAINGDVAILGDTSMRDNGPLSGGAYVYERMADGQWVETARLVPSIGEDSEFTGDYVAIDGDQLLVGQQNGDRVFVYKRDANNLWSETQIIQTAPSGDPSAITFDRQGTPLAAENGTLVVGASQTSRYGLRTGVVVVYQRDDDGQWVPVDYLASSNVQTDQQFGDSVAMVGTTVLVGARTPAEPGATAGRRAYVFDLATAVFLKDISKIR